MLDISQYSKAEVVAKLYNASRPQGLGMLQFRPGNLSVSEAQLLLDTRGCSFDYLFGRVMKIFLHDDNEFDERLYDRDNGEGAAALALQGAVKP